MALASPSMDEISAPSPPIPSTYDDLQPPSDAMIDHDELDEQVSGHPASLPPPSQSLAEPIMQNPTTTQPSSPPQQQQQQQQQVEETDDSAIPAMPISGASTAGRPKSPIVHGSYEKADSDEEEVMVKTEFVWADGAELDVKLSGAWNGWMPVQMYHEGGGMWSVVTPVPAGTHEFKFVVDGEWKHSTRHPTVGEDDETMNNIRVIRGPPKNKQNTARLSEQRNKDAGVSSNKKKMCCVS